jgi:hypothetical protein
MAEKSESPSDLVARLRSEGTAPGIIVSRLRQGQQKARADGDEDLVSAFQLQLDSMI